MILMPQMPVMNSDWHLTNPHQACGPNARLPARSGEVVCG
jgi:hypothetical protein